MVSSRAGRKSPAVQAPDKAGKGDRGRASGTKGATDDAEQHSKAGAAEAQKTVIKKFLVIVEKANGNYGAHAPDLPGCGALGGTVEETLRNMKRAMQMHIDAMVADGESVPEPTTLADYVEVPEPVTSKPS
jgi:predicted RNase H-like HicB family nuclease